jgi:hypothetical protein
MALTPPKAADLFSDATPKEAAERFEEYSNELTKSLSNASHVPGQAPQADPMATLEALAANKSLTGDAMNGLNTALAAQRVAMQDIQKEITLTSPLSTSFAAFDLEAPAKLLTPRPTPLRNRIPRKKGVGTSHRVKRILGYTGTGTGGQGQIWPGITESTQNNFAGGGSTPLELIRGPQISYTADDLILPYNSYSLSDQVSFDANFSGMGYQDLRQLSSTSTLYATMLMEERMMLMARGTASGYSGALAAPTVTAAATASVSPQVGLAAGNYYVKVTADAGISANGFGESILSAVTSPIGVTAGDVIELTITPVVGALGYNIYVALGSSTNADLKYVGSAKSPTAVIQGAAAVGLTGNNFAFSTTGPAATRAAADTSAYATGYDGILPTVLGPNTGFNNVINSTFSTANPGVEFQTAFAAMYQNVKADPDVVLINGNDRKQLSDAIKNGSTANYRLVINQPGESGTTYGSIVTGLQNEVTGKAVDIMVHPWLNSGVAPILSFTLPIPDTQVSDVWANFLVQDYMGVQWPVTQFTYDFSTYFRGTFFCTAPAWNGAVSGIVSA